MADCVVQIIDLENEISADMLELINLKKEITETINKVDNIEYKTLLEKRYLCFITWEQISDDMGISLRNIYRIHGQALKEIAKFI